ncbi:hypothetical protein FCY28_00965 [Escherichia coli]|nr:hypothetical protein [Escherichia coli]EFH9398195.1 hypothetical protein [Escherichia coli]KAA9288308.1 hypothetical protein F6I13_01350 [Escherichia coli]MDN0315112.1 hypothetical protein [Escherichia coli]MDN0391261.1 hypothetical protein [Escherichia coli]
MQHDPENFKSISPIRGIITFSPRYARSYPRHACSLHIVVFMQSHELFKASPELECLDINDPFAIMHFHAL